MFDRAHRDLTDHTRRRCQRKSSDFGETSSSSSDVSPSRSGDVPPHYAKPLDTRKQISFMIVNIPARICQDYEAAAYDWFIAVFADHSSSTRANADFLLHLHPMLQRTSVCSPLHKAVSAVAVSFAGVMSRDGTHTEKAYASYAHATRLLRNSINNAQRCLDDDVLMTALMLEFYDSVNGHFSKATGSHEYHLLGAIALIEHRKASNYKNDASKAMVDHVQNNLLQHSLHTRKALPSTCGSWFMNPLLPKTCFRHLNEISQDLPNLLVEAERVSECFEDIIDSHVVVDDLARLDKRLVAWYNALPADCYPVSAKLNDIPLAIQQIGIYRGSCVVYKNMQTATMLNLWRTRRLMLLHRLHMCVSVSISNGCTSQPGGCYCSHSTMQWLADGICDAVSFFLGDISPSKPAILAPNICFPRVEVAGRPFPESYSDHVRHATVSGAWLMMEPLSVLCHLADKKLGSYAIQLREGQLDWIKQQLKRLQ